ncbi:MAG: VCBS repeat-containing protein [Saprospiraceae bacterium]|nr:VCBS repeat-containing protein [Saprospiraceae bacterium]
MRLNKKYCLALTIFVFVLIYGHSCNVKKEGQDIAEKACSSCHMCPDPGDLDKKTWTEAVLPRMGARLGVEDYGILVLDAGVYSVDDLPKEGIIIPEEAVITQEEWAQVKKYFIENAPEKLKHSTPLFELPLAYLRPTIKKLTGYKEKADNTLIKISEKSDRVFIGGRDGKLTIYNKRLEKLDSLQFESAPTALHEEENGNLHVLLVGNIAPNNRKSGSLVKVDSIGKQTTVIQGLMRPVFMEVHDFNGDGKQEFLIGSFGFSLGHLAIYSLKENGEYDEKVLIEAPGAVKAIVTQDQKDQLPEIMVMMAQANEAIHLLTNKGNLEFKDSIIMKYAPNYGSSDMLWEDINGDGYRDLVVCHGDNADYTNIKKPYHGIRVYLASGKLKFGPPVFYPLDGASRLLAADFDNDGKKDIMVASYFADFVNSPGNGLVMLKQKEKGKFEFHHIPGADQGRWLIMDTGDLNGDGKPDLIAGSHIAGMMVDPKTLETWMGEHTDFLTLKGI